MLFGLFYTPADGTTEGTEKRVLELFAQWKAPYEFKAFYARADGKGGIAIIETDNAETVLEGITPWTAFLEFEVSPLVDIQAAVPVLQRIYEWRDSVG